MVINIILAVLVFGFLVLIHECGHYAFARLFGVAINEFSIGMGPKIFSHISKKTGIAYSLRALPVGGFVSMVGEDEESDDKNALTAKPVWQRMIIVAAGAVVNIIAGIIAMAILVAATETLSGTTIQNFGYFRSDAVTYSSTEEQGLEIGDRITKINNTAVHIADDLRYEIMYNGNEPIDVTVVRDGENVVIENVTFSTVTESGITVGLADFSVASENKTVPNVLRHTVWRTISMMRSIFDSFKGLAVGRYTIDDMSGPVGIGTTLAEAAKESKTDFVYIAVLISINLGVVNLLPLPALDGGRLLFLVIELIRRRPVNRNVEGYIHFAGIVILMAFMLFITFKDIVKLIP